MNLKITIVGLLVLVSGQALAADFQVDFRNRPLPNSVHPVGPGLETALQTDSGGVRITLSADRTNFEGVGIATNFPLQGNFEMTVGYELLQVDRPKTGYGSGLEFYLMTEAREAIGMTRMVRPDGQDLYWCSRNSTGPDGKRNYNVKPSPATGKSGKLRVTRTGSEVVCSAAEGTSEEFRELCRFDFVTDDAKLVRLTANSGHAPSAIDLRIVDMWIQSDTPSPELVAVQTMETPGTKGRSMTALIALAVIVVLTVLCFVGFWMHKRRNHRLSTTRVTG